MEKSERTPFESPVFRPSRFAIGGHLQTILPAYWPQKLPIYQATRRRVTLPDEDQIVLHDDCPGGFPEDRKDTSESVANVLWKQGDPVALLLHGLAGCHLSRYMIRVASKLASQGIRVFRMDLRGAGAGMLLAKRPYYAGCSEDAAAAVNAVRKICPNSPIVVVGFSMSGNVVLKMAAEWGENAPAPLDSVIAIAPPLDLEECSQSLRKGFNRVYDEVFLRYLYRLVREKHKLTNGQSPAPPNPAPRSLREFDDRYTAPLSGFRDVADYYARASAKPMLPQIRVRTVIVASQDDPIVPAKIFQGLSLSDSTTIVQPAGGGHLGFYARTGVDPDRHWLDWRICDWFVTRFRSAHVE